MSDKKFEFTVKEKDEIELMFDTDCLLSDVFNRIEQIISSRSASPQQGTEGAEEVLKEVAKSFGYDSFLDAILQRSKPTNRETIMELVYTAMIKFMSYRVEQAVKEKDKQISDLTFFNQEHQSYQNLSEIVIGRQKEQISQLEHALKVQTDKVGELEERISPSKNIHGVDTKESHEFFKAITKNAGRRDE